MKKNSIKSFARKRTLKQKGKQQILRVFAVNKADEDQYRSYIRGHAWQGEK